MNAEKNHEKAQASIIMIVLVLIIFAGLALFLLSFAKTMSQEDYMSTYVNSLLLSIMRTDTGYLDSDCRLVSDAISCSFFSTGLVCRDSEITCDSLAYRKVEEYINRTIKKGFRYFFSVTPEGFVARSSSGEPIKFEIGDSKLKSEKTEKWSANQRIMKATATGQYSLKVQLVIAVKK